MIGRGRNRREALADPTHHAEIEALREAGAAAGHLAARRSDALRDARAVRHVRRRRRQRADRPDRLRLRGPEGRLLRNARQHPAGPAPEPPLRGRGEASSPTNRPRLLQLFFRAKREGKPENEHHEGVWAVPDSGRLRE